LKTKRKYLTYKAATVSEICWHDPVVVEEGFYIYRQAVKQLPAKEKAVYYFYENGFSREQIAQMVKRSPNTVNNQVYIASKTVKKFFGRYLEFTIEMDGRRRFWNRAALN
jgi:DNA-directed RNA polymerase specialized sigma24 family protein